MVITRSSWFSFAPDVVGVYCAEACRNCTDSFGVDSFLLHSCLESTMVSAFTEACNVNEKCFKVYTDIDN